MDFGGGNMDDFHAFESTSGGSEGGYGCLFSDFFKVVAVISLIIFLMATCAD